MALRAYEAVYDNGVLVWAAEDRPVERHARVVVIILDSPDPSHDREEEDWHRLSLARLADAFGEDEPTYTLSDVKFR